MNEYVISIDVGIKNLGICVLNKEQEIQYWKNICIYEDDKIEKELKISALYDKLEDLKIFFHRTCVILIENQPENARFSNTKMIGIENQLLMYFTCIKKDSMIYKIEKIISYNNKNKLKYYGTLPNMPIIEQKKYSTKHTMNKWLSEEQVFHILGNRQEEDYWFKYYISQKKCSDLADCYLQALHFISLNI